MRKQGVRRVCGAGSPIAVALGLAIAVSIPAHAATMSMTAPASRQWGHSSNPSGLVANPATPPPWDPTGNCIRDETNLPVKISGPQYEIYSLKVNNDAAHAIADTLNKQNVFGVYENGLGLANLLQPGQKGPFRIFVEDKTLKAADLDGIAFRLCDHPTWMSLVVDGTISDPQELEATVEHELFHAAQMAVVQQIINANWWLEATATAAEDWFGSPDESNNELALVNNPGTPMDSFIYKDAHQYGAYLFVQWLLGSSRLPTPSGWTFLKDSFLDMRTSDPTDAVKQALADDLNKQQGEEVASFWTDHLNQVPSFGPRGAINKTTITQPYQQLTANPADPLGARLASIVPGSKVEQIEIKIAKIPNNLDMSIRLNEGSDWLLQPGDSFDELFCRNGYADGSLPLSKTGDIRLALTTIGKPKPSSFDYEVLTSSKPCPKQLTIIPGFEMGTLHLGMTMKEVNKVAKKAGGCFTTQDPNGGGTLQTCLYEERLGAYVAVWTLNKRVILIATSGPNRNFITTTGIQTSGPAGLGGVIPGSTEEDFVKSAAGVSCVTFGKNPNDNHACAYEHPTSRYTFALTGYEDGKQWPGPDFYVGDLGVATQEAYDLVVQYGLNP